MRSILVGVLIATFVPYGTNCQGAATEAQAMCCCRFMHCSHQGHQGRDCCKRISTLYSPFVQPSAEYKHFSRHVVIADAPESVDAPKLDPPVFSVTAQSHAPPDHQAFTFRPIRI